MKKCGNYDMIIKKFKEVDVKRFLFVFVLIVMVIVFSVFADDKPVLLRGPEIQIEPEGNFSISFETGYKRSNIRVFMGISLAPPMRQTRRLSITRRSFA